MNLAEANKIRDAISRLRVQLISVEEKLLEMAERILVLEQNQESERFHVEPSRRAVGRPRKT